MPDLVPIEHDPFVAAADSGELQHTAEGYPFYQAAPPSGDVTAPASQYRSPWADSPIAALGRSLPEFWKEFYKRYAGAPPIRQASMVNPLPPGATEPVEHDPFAEPTVKAGEGAKMGGGYKLEPVDHDPFITAPQKDN